MKRALIALTLAAALCLGAAGCSTPQAQINQHNATLYVQGFLDETYTGSADQGYYTLVEHTAEDAQAAFEKNLEAELSQRVCLRFELDEQHLSRSLKKDYLALLDELYQHARYSVKAATPLGDGRYCVEVSVTSVTFFAAAYADGYKTLQADFEKDHPRPDEEALSQLSPADQRKAEADYEALWAQEVYDYLYPRLDAVTTGAVVTKLVLVSPDSHGRYTISATDLQDVDDLILQY